MSPRAVPQRFQILFEASPTPAALLGADLRILAVNPAARAAMGNVTEAEVVGQDALERMLGAQADLVSARDELLAALSRGHHRFTARARSLDSGAATLEVVATCLTTDSEPELLVVWTDVTAQQRHARALAEAQEALENATRAKTDLLARMSHELLTPMNGILGMTELLLGTKLTTEQREYLVTTRASARNLLTLVDDILDFTKADAGMLRFVELPFGLREVLAEIMVPFGMTAQDKGVELMLLVEPDVPDRLVGDARRVRQVLSNLVSNALKFTGDGEVFVWVRKTATREGEVTLRFSVSDTGIGIPSSRHVEIFQPFMQGRVPNVVVSGPGLGLAICSKLVRQMNGTVGFSSEVGEGSEFHFEIALPFQPDHTPAMQPDLGDLSVLVVGENERHRHLVSETIRGWKGRPRAARDVEGALEAIQQARQGGSPVGLVIVDSDLSADGATRLLRELDARPALERLPCVVLASRAFPRTDAHRGSTVRVSKPVLVGPLFEAIEGVFSGRAGTDEDEAPPAQAFVPAEVAVPTGGRVEVASRSGLETLAPMKVLVVDDNSVNRKVAIGLLEQAGHRAVPAEHGCEALDIIDRERFDLVLMDVEMPNMDGIDTTQLIRAREEVLGSHLPVVALTALASEEGRKRCLDAGMDDHLGKPLDPAALVRIVRRLIPQPSATPVPAPVSVEDAPPPSSGPIDIGQLEMQVGGSQELLRELVQVFLEDVPEMMTSLEDSVAQADPKAITNSAHKLKGALLSLAAVQASELAKKLENLGRSERPADAPPLLPLLRAELDAVQNALRQAAGRTA